MITYDPDRWYGFHKLVSMRGSVVLSVLPRCIFSACLCILINKEDLIYFPKNAYAFQIFTFGFSFLVIMRSNLAYSRYWEWLDATSQIIAFDELAVGPAGASGPKFRAHLVHLMSLLSAVATLELQGDDDTETMIEAIRPYESTEEISSITVQPGVKEASVRPPSSPVKVAPTRGHDSDETSASESEGEEDDEEEPCDAPDLPVIGGMNQVEFGELCKANEEDAQVHYLTHKMVRLVSKRHKEGGLAAPPPIVGRIFQEISNGLLGFENANKVATIPFPFPYAQTVQYLQLSFIITCPFVVVAFVDELYWQMIFTFLGTFCFTALNAVASELEDPFGHDDNDLPLRALHTGFVKKLNQLLHSVLTDADYEALRQDKIEETEGIESPQIAADRDFDAGLDKMMKEASKLVVGTDGAVLHEQAFRAVFESLDQNGNGVLDHEETRELCKRIGLSYSEEKYAHMMRKVDPEATGEITFELFWAWFTKKHKKMLKKQAANNVQESP